MNELLIPALRQYLHNDGSGFVAGYDREDVDLLVKQLQDENVRLKEVQQNMLKVLTPKVVNLIRIGIDSNYGRDYFYSAMEEYPCSLCLAKSQEKSRSIQSYDENGELNYQLAMCQQRIAELEILRQWISINDRMPDIGQKCLILHKVYGNIEKGNYIGNGDWQANWCNRAGKNQVYKITHWMPWDILPEEE